MDLPAEAKRLIRSGEYTTTEMVYELFDYAKRTAPGYTCDIRIFSGRMRRLIREVSKHVK